MADEFNAFAEGVELGGLRNKTQIKLLLEYLVSNLKEPVTAQLLTDILTEGNLANYFEVVQALDELVENSSLEKNENGFLTLTAKGNVAVRELGGELPASVKESALDLAEKTLLQLHNRQNNFAEIVSDEKGYKVICNVKQNEIVLMKVEIFASDYETAERVKRNFDENPAETYKAVTNKLFA